MKKFKSPDCISIDEIYEAYDNFFPSPKEGGGNITEDQDFLSKLKEYESRYSFDNINNDPEKTLPPENKDNASILLNGEKELQENEEVEIIDIF